MGLVAGNRLSNMQNHQETIHYLASEVVAEVAEKARAAKHRERVAGQRSKTRLLLAIILVLLIALLTVQLGAEQYPPLSVEQTASFILEEMSVMVYDLEDYLQANGAYPENLSLLELPTAQASGWDYRLIGPDRYQLSFRRQDQSRSYDSREHVESFFIDVRGED